MRKYRVILDDGRYVAHRKYFNIVWLSMLAWPTNRKASLQDAVQDIERDKQRTQKIKVVYEEEVYR